MASLASFTRSAARATSSASKRVPIRWRLAGGSALLTLVILVGFAVMVGILTTRQIRSDFDQQITTAANNLQGLSRDDLLTSEGRCNPNINLDGYAASGRAVVRVLAVYGDAPRVLCATRGAVDLGYATRTPALLDYRGYRVAYRTGPTLTVLVTPEVAIGLGARTVSPLGGNGLEPVPIRTMLEYARPLSSISHSQHRVWVFVVIGVLGGAGLALLAGLVVARRAMRPIARLTATARQIERTRDPGLRVPQVDARDEVGELARTLDLMLRSLNSAQGETEAALARQRAFVADASHELRTPLTSVLANLELLAEQLEGEERDAAQSALRSTQRMRRLVADLLLLARADAGREARHAPTDLASVLVDVAAELEPVAGTRRLAVQTTPAIVDGAADELHRMALNLMENALRHTPEHTAVEATVDVNDGQVVLAVEDDGPGVAPDLAPHIFDRFVRGAADRGGSSGLGLAIVRAVAEAHGGSVTLEPPLDGVGARFVVRLPAARGHVPATPEPTALSGER